VETCLKSLGKIFPMIAHVTQGCKDEGCLKILKNIRA